MSCETTGASQRRLNSGNWAMRTSDRRLAKDTPLGQLNSVGSDSSSFCS